MKMRFGARARRFRKLITKSHGLVLRPCAFDPMTAILIEKAGFRVCGTSGYAISAAYIGEPDMGLLGFEGMLDQVRRIANATILPVDVDADTGYGNVVNVTWTTEQFIRVDAAGIRVEDQVWPKRCGHMTGCKMISQDEMVEKIRAAKKVCVELSSELVIGARTDARSVEGFEATVGRVTAYAEAGADYVYVECPKTLDEVGQLIEAIPDTALAFNMIPGGKTPIFSLQTLEEMGVKYISIPMVAIYPAVRAIQDALATLKQGDLKTLGDLGCNWQEFNDLIGKARWDAVETGVVT